MKREESDLLDDSPLLISSLVRGTISENAIEGFTTIFQSMALIPLELVMVATRSGAESANNASRDLR